MPVLLLSACAADSVPSPPKLQLRQPFLIGVFGQQGPIKQYEQYQPLVTYLSTQTGLDVRIEVLPHYHSRQRSFAAGKMDAAFFGSLSYMLAHEKQGVQVIARPVALDGTSTYHGVIFARRDSMIRTWRDMRGKRFALVRRETTAGYLLPLVFFRQAGVRYRGYLKEAYFSGTHEAAIYDVLNGKADVGAAKNTEFERLAVENPRVKNELVVLARSPEVPKNSFAVRKGLDPAVIEKLKNALLHMHETLGGMDALNKLGALRFISTGDSDFEAVSAYARAAGVDLRHWNEPPEP